MTFTQAPIGWDKDKHGLKINTPEGKFGTETLNRAGEWFGDTWYGKRFNEAQQKDRELEQQLIDRGGPAAWVLKIRNTPNPKEQEILKSISDITNFDERITTPITYLAAGALLGKGLPKAYNKLNQQPWAHNYMHARGQTLRSRVDRMANQLTTAKNVGKHIVKKGKTAYKQRFGPASGRVFPIKAETIIDDVFNNYTNAGNARGSLFKPKPLPGTNPADTSRQIHSWENRPVYIPRSELAPFQKGGALMTTTGGENLVPDDPLQNARSIRRAFDSHLTQGGRRMALNYRALMNNRTFRNGYLRLVAGDWATNWASGLPATRSNLPSRQVAFNNLRTELLRGFEEDYGEALNTLGYSSSDIDLDHRLTLVQSAGMYHNVGRNSPLYQRIQQIALKRGYKPGDNPDNLDLVAPEVHRLKTRFFNDLHGLQTKDSRGRPYNNMKYWNGKHRDTGRRRIDIMDKSHKGQAQEDLHIEIVQDYFDHVDRGAEILDTAQVIWKTNYKKGILPEEIVSELYDVVIDTNTNYTPESLNIAIEAVIEDELSRSTKGLGELEKAVSDQAEKDEYASSVRQVQQDTDPEYLPKSRRVQSQQKKKEKNIKIDDDKDTQLHL